MNKILDAVNNRVGQRSGPASGPKGPLFRGTSPGYTGPQRSLGTPVCFFHLLY